MVKEMMSRIILFVVGLGRASSKEERDAMLIGDMDISMLMFCVKQVEKEKLRDREEYISKKIKTGMRLGNKRVVRIGHSFRKKGVCSVIWYCSCTQKQRVVEILAREPNLHQLSHQKELYLEEPLLVLPEVQTSYVQSLATKRNTSLQMLSPGMIKVFNFDIYVLVDPGASLSFVIPSVANQFEILPEKL
ncbi:uncharacterized protein [Solanum lycopersicum]|uniref:uncharacterized protein n=1 Tax=Solanum lycopersicum TaxID=4081 RepID=UPI0002BCBBC4|nr:uncharacterized protein LOC101243916 [Solanum lycopersicum]